jgi:hypothetical protein
VRAGSVASAAFTRSHRLVAPRGESRRERRREQDACGERRDQQSVGVLRDRMPRGIGTREAQQRRVVSDRVCQRVAAKQHPAAHDDRERVRMRDETMPGERPREPGTLGDEKYAMPRAPQDEWPARAVPQPA